MKLALILVLAAAAYAGKVSENIINPDPDNGKVLSPEYNSTLVEGDIVPSKAGSKEDRNALKDENRLWPQGKVPYVIDRSVGKEMKEKIKAAIADYTSNTCVRWVQRSNEVDYVKIKSDESGCFARLGRQGGQQDLNLQNPTRVAGGITGCHVKGIVIHEMLHTIGFAHEQARADRDKYVTIHWDNIKRNSKSQFDKMEAGTENNMGFGYDYDSVMHYEDFAFAIDRSKKVITTRSSKDQSRIGQRAGFSKQDVREVNKLYKCSGGRSGIGGKNGCTDNPNISPSCKEFMQKYGQRVCGQANIAQHCRLSCKKC